ncbi:MAG: chlorophyll synthase ChlG [Anaerolineae bacterium]|nr:chlorophyll synthase ChlG [Thermoflexales bacterium]MDW8395519.1 chlorophyll synthase ChlG [Anaerolineae bacterium]
MSQAPTTAQHAAPLPFFKVMITLMEPYTWFAPTWAFVVGCVASHNIFFDPLTDLWQSIVSVGKIAIGTLMAGPLLVGFSQVWNDWCDREVDAINQPERLIPSGKATPGQVFAILAILGALAMAIAVFLGWGVALVAAIGVVIALAYSAEPIRLKKNGWLGNLAIGLTYETCAWIAGHLTFDPELRSAHASQSVVLAVIYGLGVVGTMIINDFKSVAGDRAMGIRSIPAMFGESNAARIAVLIINAAQLAAVVLQGLWGRWIPALICLLLMAAQWRVQAQLVREPTQPMAVRYNIIGIPPYTWAMLVAALGLR